MKNDELLTRRYRVPSHAMVRTVGGEAVLLNLDNEGYYGLDDVGRDFLDALTESPSVADARARLLERYDVAEPTLDNDLERLIEELLAHGLLEAAPG